LLHNYSQIGNHMNIILRIFIIYELFDACS
jgi:hypothetical protein